MRVFMRPDETKLRGRPGGIPRVLEAYVRGMSERGWRFVSDESKARIVVNHAGERGTRQPDVHVCHGLYPTGENIGKFSQPSVNMNAGVVENLRTARLVTVPCGWVGEILRRDMHLIPEVVPHGIWTDEYAPAGDANGPVIWPKTRVDPVCDPRPMIALARALPKVRFMAIPRMQALPDNIVCTGAMPYQNYLDQLGKCSVYLATTKETGGWRCFGVMEALAMGVPVVGYRYGYEGELPIDNSGVTLVEPGDLDALQEALVRVLNRWPEHHEQALALAPLLDWNPVLDYIDRLWRGLKREPKEPLVSVVIPNHNYGRYLRAAVDSALAQEYKNIEVVVVDDFSEDDSRTVIESYGERIRPVFLETNVGVAEARNIGIAQARGEYITCLDSDDVMYPHFISHLLPALLADRGSGVAYGGLDTMQEDGSKGDVTWFNAAYDYERAWRNGANFIPSCCLYRKEAWRRAGGYRTCYPTGEDGDFWLRVAGLGWRVAPVPGRSVYQYRRHSDSLSVSKPRGDYFGDKKAWTAAYFAAGGDAGVARAVRNYDAPDVTVVIPLRAGQEKHLTMALDSLESQDFYKWECIVVNATGRDGDALLRGHPFARCVTDKGEVRARARKVYVMQPSHYLALGQLREIVKAWPAEVGTVRSDWPWGEWKEL